MKKFLVVLVSTAFMCISCAASIGPRGTSITIAPPLPVTVELFDPYYTYGGYYYYYHSDRWYYSGSKSGPWRDLPRDRYPREIRHKGKDHGKDWGHERGEEAEKDKRYDRGQRDDKKWKRDKD